MALHGTLDTFPLSDVLALLASTSKVGRLQVEGLSYEGTLWVDGASIVGAACGDSSEVLDVMVALLRLEEGVFRFDADETPPFAPVAHPIDDALAEATAYLDEWRAIEAVLPSLDHIVRLRAELESPEVTISASDWRGIAAIGGGGPVRDLTPRFGSTELEGARVLAGLVGTGVIEVLAPSGSPAEPQVVRQAPVIDEPSVAVAPAPAAPPSAPAALPAPAPAAASPAKDDADELGNGQPWRDQVRQLLESGPMAAEPPAERAPSAPPPASAASVPEPRSPEQAAAPASDGERDVLLKFLSSVQR